MSSGSAGSVAGSVDLRAVHRDVDGLVEKILATDDPDEKVALFATVSTRLVDHFSEVQPRAPAIDQALAEMMDLDVQSEPFRDALAKLREVASLGRCQRCNR